MMNAKSIMVILAHSSCGRCHPRCCWIHHPSKFLTRTGLEDSDNARKPGKNVEYHDVLPGFRSDNRLTTPFFVHFIHGKWLTIHTNYVAWNEQNLYPVRVTYEPTPSYQKWFSRASSLFNIHEFLIRPCSKLAKYRFFISLWCIIMVYHWGHLPLFGLAYSGWTSFVLFCPSTFVSLSDSLAAPLGNSLQIRKCKSVTEVTKAIKANLCFYHSRY